MLHLPSLGFSLFMYKIETVRSLPRDTGKITVASDMERKALET